MKYILVFRRAFLPVLVFLCLTATSTCFSSDDEAISDKTPLAESTEAVEPSIESIKEENARFEAELAALAEAERALKEAFKALDSSIAGRFGVFDKSEEEIDWEGLAEELGFQAPKRQLMYELLPPDHLTWNSGRDLEFPVYDDMLHGRYDKAIASCRKALRKYWVFVGADSEAEGTSGPYPVLLGTTSRLRFFLYVYARAYEFKEMFDDAKSVYDLLYGEGDEELKWIDARLRFSRAKRENLRLNSISFIYKQLAEYKDVCFDSVIAELETWSQLDDPSAAFLDIIAPFDSRGVEVRYYAEARRLYVLRDRCAQTINPKLHFTLDDNPAVAAGAFKPHRLVLLSRASYLAFLDLLEADYKNYLARLNGEEPDATIRDGMEVARQLARLPY